MRHAETVANASGATGGEGDLEDHDSLTALGRKQIEALKNFLVEKDIIPDVIMVSPTWRTQKTIEPFLLAANVTAEIWVELNECCGREPTGEALPTERPEQRWKMPIEIVAENTVFRDEQDDSYWWPGTYEEGLFMVMTARDRILEFYGRSGKTVLIVGHAVNGGILLGLLTGYDMLQDEPERPFWLRNTGLLLLEQDPVSGNIEVVNQRVNDPPQE
ncbi:MAG: histidine phosphatase family protein [Chitinispirillaceae bacterium]|nr:histidine phosphatase family protein [Chitinispirillaceae bacterium]